MSDPWNTFDLNGDGKTDMLERAFEASFLDEVLFKEEPGKAVMSYSESMRRSEEQMAIYDREVQEDREIRRTSLFVRDELPELEKWFLEESTMEAIAKQRRYGFECIEYKKDVVSCPKDGQLGRYLYGMTGNGSPVVADFYRHLLLFVYPQVEMSMYGKRTYCAWSCVNLEGKRISPSLYQDVKTSKYVLGALKGDAKFLWKMGRLPVLRKTEEKSGRLYCTCSREEAAAFLDEVYDDERRLLSKLTEAEYDELLLERIRRSRNDIACHYLNDADDDRVSVLKWINDGEPRVLQEEFREVLTVPGMPNAYSLEGVWHVISVLFERRISLYKEGEALEGQPYDEWDLPYITWYKRSLQELTNFLREEEEFQLWKQLISERIMCSEEEHDAQISRARKEERRIRTKTHLNENRDLLRSAAILLAILVLIVLLRRC